MTSNEHMLNLTRRMLALGTYRLVKSVFSIFHLITYSEVITKKHYQRSRAWIVHLKPKKQPLFASEVVLLSNYGTCSEYIQSTEEVLNAQTFK